MELFTERLKIVPLTNYYLNLFVNNFERLEIQLKLQQSKIIVDECIKEVARSMYNIGLQKTYEYPWWTIWLIILKHENRYIGSVFFKGFPDINGQVEIGYMLEPQYRNTGFMTEAIKTTCDWALEQEGVLNITAETDKVNVPSQNVLRNNKFYIYDNTEDRYFWRLNNIQN